MGSERLHEPRSPESEGLGLLVTCFPLVSCSHNTVLTLCPVHPGYSQVFCPVVGMSASPNIPLLKPAPAPGREVRSGEVIGCQS